MNRRTNSGDKGILLQKVGLAGIQQTLGEIKGKLENHDQKFDSIEHRFDSVDKKLVEHDQKFDHISKKLVEHDQKFDRIDEKLTAHDQKFDRIDEKLTAHDQQFVNIGKKLTEHSQQFGRDMNKLLSHDDRFNDLEKKFDEKFAGLKDFMATNFDALMKTYTTHDTEWKATYRTLNRFQGQLENHTVRLDIHDEALAEVRFKLAARP
ncbi:MAG: hypothetical protein V1707_03770 [bacterium]